MWYRDFFIYFASLSLSLKNFSLSVKKISLLGGPERFGLERFGLEKNVSISVFIKFWSREQNMSFRFGWHLEKILKLFLRASITGAVCLIYKRK